jgi:hypothetical protein
MIGLTMAVALAVTLDFFLVRTWPQFARQAHARIGWSYTSDAPHVSDLLGDVFKSAEAGAEVYQPVAKGTLQFQRDIAPIIYKKCAGCHNTGGPAPFHLTTFNEVKKQTRRVGQAISRGLMPPWLPDRCSQKFVADPTLTTQEKGMIEQWLEEGSREGNRADAPPPPRPAPEWPNGSPDAILQPSEAWTVPAEGADVYRCFVIPTNFGEDRYVRVADIAPGNPRAVHHVVLYVDNSGAARKLDAAEPGPGFSVFGALGFNPIGQMGVWAPGLRARPLPDGVGYFLPKGADVILQIHYQPTGKEERDQSRVALYFCDKPVGQKLRYMPIAVPPRRLRVPPGENKAVFWAEQRMPGDITVVQMVPHMHLIGREIAAAAILPDSATIPLIRISNWDFRWQNSYSLETPLHLPKGTRVRLEALFDNSSSNARNPNQPPKFVRFGKRTTDEMCILYLFYTVDSEDLTQNRPAPTIYPDTFQGLRWGEFAGGAK